MHAQPVTDPIQMVSDPSAAAALLHPERRRLLDALEQAPDSAAGLARRLGEKRQRLNYHLRALEEAGLIAVEAERRRGNMMERVYRVTARRFVVDPSVFGGGELDPASAGDRFSALYLLALASRAIREVAGLKRKAERERKRLATAGLDTVIRLARPADMEAFTEDLVEAIAGVVARHHRPEGRPFRVVLGTYPGPPGGPEITEGGDA